MDSYTGAMAGPPSGKSFLASGGRGSSFKIRRSQQLCSKSTMFFCTLEILLGALTFTYAVYYGHQGYLKLGAAAGLVTVALGFAGLAGVVARLDRALILHLILAIVACLLSLTYADKVDEGVAIDCAFAETFIRLGNLESQAQHHTSMETFSMIFNRINELDDLIDSASRGTLAHLEIRDQQNKVRAIDERYINSKLEGLRTHARDALSRLQDRAANLTLSVGTPAEIGAKRAERRRLEATCDALMRVIQKIDGHTSGTAALSPHDYEAMLETVLTAAQENALVESEGGPGGSILLGEAAVKHGAAAGGGSATAASLAQEKHEIPFVANAVERFTANSYSSFQWGAKQEELTTHQKLKTERRDIFVRAFIDTMQRKHDKHAQGLQDRIDKMPEHCVELSKLNDRVFILGWLSLALYLASAFGAFALLYDNVKLSVD